MIKQKQGFTLIEIIISLAIVGILLITLITVFTSGISWISNAGFKSEANLSEQKELEKKLLTPTALEIDTIFFDFDTGVSISQDGIYQFGGSSAIADQQTELIGFIPHSTIASPPNNEDEDEDEDEVVPDLVVELSQINLSAYLDNPSANIAYLSIMPEDEGVIYTFTSAESAQGNYMFIETSPHRIRITRHNNSTRTGVIKLTATYGVNSAFKEFNITIPSSGAITISN